MDGVGIGTKNSSINPFFKANLPTLKYICGGEIPAIPFKNKSTKHAEVIGLDACLGVKGLPQSGTNQVAIFTGLNGPKKYGRHFGPYPPSALRQILKELSIFTALKKLGRSVVFVNAYPPEFHTYLAAGTIRLTVTTLSCQYAEIPLLTERELLQNKALSSDLTREKWRELGYKNIIKITSQEAGKHFFDIAINNDLSVFEYWLPDHAGHRRNMDEAVGVLEKLDDFLHGFLEQNLRNVTLIIVSDHGNVEDLSTKSHTINNVPCIIVGDNRKSLGNKIRNLLDIAPSILNYLK